MGIFSGRKLVALSVSSPVYGGKKSCYPTIPVRLCLHKNQGGYKCVCLLSLKVFKIGGIPQNENEGDIRGSNLLH